MLLVKLKNWVYQRFIMYFIVILESLVIHLNLIKIKRKYVVYLFDLLFNSLSKIVSIYIYMYMLI